MKETNIKVYELPNGHLLIGKCNNKCYIKTPDGEMAAYTHNEMTEIYGIDSKEVTHNFVLNNKKETSRDINFHNPDIIHYMELLGFKQSEDSPSIFKDGAKVIDLAEGFTEGNIRRVVCFAIEVGENKKAKEIQLALNL